MFAAWLNAPSRPRRPRVALAAIVLMALLAGGAANAQDRAAAAAVDPRMQLRAQAVAFEHGEGVPKDARKAAALYCEAARDGDPDAMVGLGWMYANGRGVARDDMVAAALFAEAADAGNEYARRALAFVGTERGALPDCMMPPPAPLVLPLSAEFEIRIDDPDPFVNLPSWKQKIADVVIALAPKYAIEPRFALAVIAVESNFEPRARSEKDARGLMQLIPETAERFNVRDAFNVKDNVNGGLAYLRWLLAYYRGQVHLAAAAYNAGEGAVDRHKGIPPYAETRDYVRRIQKLFKQEYHPYDARVVGPSPILARHAERGS